MSQRATAEIRPYDAAALFDRHLDLAPLGRRRRGLVKCRFHEDRAASLSIDLDRGVFHCFGCGEQGGMRRFAELVGDRPIAAPRALRHESPLQAARREILRLARRQPWNREDVIIMYEASERLRLARNGAVQIRRLAIQFGDREDIWELLAIAAHMEVLAEVLEGELDGLLAMGHVV